MNRRSSIKYLAVFVTFGVSSVSLYKLVSNHSAPDLTLLLKKQSLIAELVDIIIPRTDTPGAKDAYVDQFVIKMISYGSDATVQRTFINGIQELEKYCEDTYSKEFVQCSIQDRTNVMKHFESKSNHSNPFLNKVKTKIFGQSFFQKLKDLTVEGYCTSQIGATQGLAYDYIPSSYESCVLLRNNQRSWATK
jgi:hypothetical protein